MPHYAVDRIEGPVAVLVGEDGREHAVPRARLPKGVVEGCVLAAELGRTGRPKWASATLDEPERRRRMDEAERRLRELTRHDPGGDVVL